MAIDPIIYMNGQALMAGRKPILRDWSGKPVAIGGKPIQRDWSGKPVAIGGQPVLHPPGTPTSDEVGGLPVINGLDGATERGRDANVHPAITYHLPAPQSVAAWTGARVEIS